jgi:hypothetical protein
MTNVDAQGRWIEVQRPTQRVVTVTTLQAGQAKPYGDSWYRYRVTIHGGYEGQATTPMRFTPAMALAAAQPLIGETLYWPGATGHGPVAPHAFVPVIQTCEETEPGVWLIEARAIYND